jgi:hypothetical protein
MLPVTRFTFSWRARLDFLDEDMVPVPPLLASTLVAAARHGCFPRAQIVDLTQFQYNLPNPDYDLDDDTNSGQEDEGETLDASEDDSARRPEDNDAMSPIAAVNSDGAVVTNRVA